jgi:hypothetical protein
VPLAGHREHHYHTTKQCRQTKQGRWQQQ